MTRTTAVLAAAAALAAAGRAFPGQDAPRKDEMELKCVAVPSRGRPHIRLEGQAPTLPEGARLSINLIRIEERISEGRLIVGGEFYHSEITAVDRKGRIAYSCAVGGPGYFRAVVKLSEEIQGARSLDALKKAKTLMPQEWTFDYTAWGDELAGRLSPALQEFDALAGQATALVGKYAEASAQRALWEASRNALDRESARLLNDISKSEAKSLFPAAASDITASLGTVQAASNFFTFQADGRFDKIVDYHTAGKPAVTYRQEEFNWDTVKKYLTEASEAAGREFALWVIKDIRRAGKVSETLIRAIKNHADHPGLSLYTNRLQQGEHLEELENLIRQKPKG